MTNPKSGWQAPLAAALVALAAALPAMLALPVIDGSEARFAQATAQMLEGGGLSLARFQDAVQPAEPPAAHWIQALFVGAFSSEEARQIWAYRLPSLLAVAFTAAVVVFGGARLLDRRSASIAGIGFAVSVLALTLAAQAGLQALFMAATTASMTGLGLVYSAVRAGQKDKRIYKVLFWVGIICGLLTGGPWALGLPLVALAALAIADRDARWMGRLGWTWGVLSLAGLFGAWLTAAIVESDGDVLTFDWLISGAGGHGAQTVSAGLFLFPLVFALPFAAVFAWRERARPGARFALAWAAPGWIFLELAPGFSSYDAAALFPPLFWLIGAGLNDERTPKAARLVGAVLSVAGALGVALAWLRIESLFGGLGVLTVLICGALLATAFLGALAALRTPRLRYAAFAAAGGLLAQWLAFGLSAPRLEMLWPARTALAALSQAQLDPRDGLARGPVAISGYDSPALVFALGDRTEVGDGVTAARALADGRPAIVERSQEPLMAEGLRRLGAEATPVQRFKARRPADGGELDLVLYRPGA